MKGKEPVWFAAMAGCALAMGPGCSGGSDLAAGMDASPASAPHADAATETGNLEAATVVPSSGGDAARADDGDAGHDHNAPEAERKPDGGTALDASFTEAGSSGPDGSDECKATIALPLSGAFLQLTNAYAPAFWKGAVDQMRQAGMSTAIIQTVAYAGANGSATNVNPSVIEMVLDEADVVGIDVYIGLRLEMGNGSASAAANAGTVNGWIANARTSADAIAASYGAHPAFAGWYLPMEGWTPARAGELGSLPSYYSAVSAYCKTKKNVPVAISPFISSGALAQSGAPSLTTSTYTAILAASSIDVVMLQDGTGALPIAPAAVGSSIPPFMAAMKSACAANHVELWANAEAFEHDFSTPTTLDRLKAQLAAASASAVRAVTFEFSSYWDGAGPGGVAAASLFNGYVQARQGCAP
jgi:hypothetical protein